MKFDFKEIIATARGLVTRKMLITAGVPLLLLAVAVGFLSIFTAGMSERIEQNRFALMFEAALEAFPGAEISELADFESPTFEATLEGKHAGFLVAVPVAQGFDRLSFVAVAVEAGGAIIYEKAFAPAGPARERALEAARELALSLGGERGGL